MTAVSRRRLVAVATVMLMAGVQLGLWLADWYDDGVHSALSLAIGLAILAAGIGTAAGPFIRRPR